MSPGVALLVAVLLLIANAFFVAVEFGLIATSRSQLEEKAETSRAARRALDAITNLNNQIAGAQLGITMASIALGLVAEPSIAAILNKTLLKGFSHDTQHTISLIIALSFVTFLHIFLGEMVPKNIALADAPRTAMMLAPIHGVFVKLAMPLVWLLNGISIVILRLFGVEPADERGEAKDAAELAMLLEEAHDGEVLDGYDFALLSNTLELGAKSVSEAMVPWADVWTVSDDASACEVSQELVKSGHSRLVVIDDDGPMRWVHAKDLLSVDQNSWDARLATERKRDLIRINTSTGVEDALEKMQSERQHLALAVTDNKVMGIITLEDVLEILVTGLDEVVDAVAERDIGIAVTSRYGGRDEPR